MSLRKLFAYAPVAAPTLCAFVMMAVALALSGAFAERDGERCCGAADVSLPKVAAGRMPALKNLLPDLYARRINYVAAAEFQTVVEEALKRLNLS